MVRDTSTIKQIERLILPMLAEFNFQLVDIEIVRGKNRSILRIFIDKMGGITVDDLTAFSHRIEDSIDAEDIFEGSYTLEVSSPGLDRRVRYPDDFNRFAGRQIRIKTHTRVDGSNNISGILLGMQGDAVAIKRGESTVLIELDNIDHANLIYDWGETNGGEKSYGK
jgi:ribosome maturation factor RimP